MEGLLNYFIFSLGLNLILFLIAFLFQTDKLTDISFSFTFTCIALYSFFTSEQSFVDIILMGIVVLWALRLGSYLFYRVHYMGSDDRFKEIRKNFTSFLFFWFIQGLTCFIVMLPIILVNRAPGKTPSFVFILGVSMALIGFLIESIADAQKFAFKKKHPSRFMHTGLWKIVQHPNYSGELLFWWAILIATLPFQPGYLAIAGPIWISLIIIFFSGIRILQNRWKAQYRGNPSFDNYQKKTKKLIPFIF